MKRSAIQAALCVAMASVVACHRPVLPVPRTPLVASPDEAWRSAPPTLAEMPALEAPELYVRRLANGLLVVVAEDHALPVVEIAYASRLARAEDETDDAGITSFMLRSLWRATSVTERRGIRNAFGARGVDVQTRSSLSGSVVRATVPAADVADHLELLARVVRRPLFDEASMSDARIDQAEAIVHAWRTGPTGTYHHARQMLYGAARRGAPLVGEAEALRGFDVTQVRARHADLIEPSHAAVVVVGDVEPGVALATVARAFGTWPAGSAVPASRALGASARSGDRLRAVHLPGQSVAITMLSAAPPTGHADAPAFELLATALGGHFRAPLNLELRETRGDTYGVEASYHPLPERGELAIELRVAPEATRATVDVLRGAVERVRREGLTLAELGEARRAARARRELTLESREALHAALVGAFLARGEVLDALAEIEAFERVTSSDVVRAAEWIAADRTAIVVGGDMRALRRQLWNVIGVEFYEQGS